MLYVSCITAHPFMADIGGIDPLLKRNCPCSMDQKEPRFELYLVKYNFFVLLNSLLFLGLFPGSLEEQSSEYGANSNDCVSVLLQYNLNTKWYGNSCFLLILLFILLSFICCSLCICMLRNHLIIMPSKHLIIILSKPLNLNKGRRKDMNFFLLLGFKNANFCLSNPPSSESHISSFTYWFSFVFAAGGSGGCCSLLC